MSKKIKPRIMFAVFSGPQAKIPVAIFDKKEDADWFHREMPWGRTQRVMVEYSDKDSYTIYRHEYANLDTDPDDPSSVSLIEAAKRWASRR